MKVLFPAAAAALWLAISGTASPVLAARPKAVSTRPDPADFRPVDPDDLLVIDTNRGRIIAELTPWSAPQTVERVQTLARRHFYDGLTFFRVIDDFMDQTGDPKNDGSGQSDLPNVKGEFVFRRDSSLPFTPALKMDDETEGFIGPMAVASQPDALMLMTADSRVNAWPLFCPGVLGMARSADADSGNSQFFLLRSDYASLEKKYAAFGRVLIGEDVVRAIKLGEPVPDPQDRMLKVRLASDMPPAERPKVYRLDPRSASFARILAAARGPDGDGLRPCDVQIPAEIR